MPAPSPTPTGRHGVHRLIPPHALAALLLALTAASGASAQAARSATVTFASADAVIVSAQGERRPARLGLTLSSGDTIETGKGRVQLRMVDGGLMSLQPDTTLRLDDYHLASEGGTDEKGYMSLVKGGLRTVSGFIGKARPDNYRLQTPTGMIGIRGTEYTAVLRDGLTVGVIGGRVAVCNDGGCADVARGMSAFVASRTERPVLSKLVSVVVPASTPAAASTSEVAQATTSATPAAAVRTSGEEVRSYLVALARPVEPGTGEPASGSDGASAAPTKPATTSVPGSFSPPPAVLAAATTPATTPTTPSAPGNAPVTPTSPADPTNPADPGNPSSPTGPAGPKPPAPPGPGPGGPLPGPGFVESPMRSGNGTVTAVTSDDKGKVGALQATGYRTFAGLGLTQVQEAQDSGKKLLDKGTPVQAHSDGNVAWGRWTSGKHSADDANGLKGDGDVDALHYFTFAGTPTLPVLKTFASFASTATTVTSNKGVLLGTGAENAASGTLTVTFPGPLGGFASYNLAVPVSGQTFTLSGTALQSNVYGFAGGATIASNGNGCAAGCAGVLANGTAVQGMVGGSSSGRAGLVYGFSSGLGNVTGAMVFKP